MPPKVQKLFIHEHYAVENAFAVTADMLLLVCKSLFNSRPNKESTKNTRVISSVHGICRGRMGKHERDAQRQATATSQQQ